MKQEDKEDFDDKNVCRLCEKEILSDKVRDHCHLTGKYRGTAPNNCNFNVINQKSNIIPFIFHNFTKLRLSYVFQEIT